MPYLKFHNYQLATRSFKNCKNVGLTAFVSLTLAILAIIFPFSAALAQKNTTEENTVQENSQEKTEETTQPSKRDNRPKLRLTRNNRVIEVIQNAPSNEGGKFHLRATCGENARTNTVFAPNPYLVETTVNDMLITSNIVLDERPDGKQDNAKLQLFGGELEIDEKFCPDNVIPTSTPEVTVYQGRTEIKGLRFTYENATGMGTLEGPITLARATTEDSNAPALNVTADTLLIDVDKDVTLLTGNTTIEADGRSSQANEVEYDEANSKAILRGDPAVSTIGDDTVKGNVIEYDLESNDVVVKGGIAATFDFNP